MICKELSHTKSEVKQTVFWDRVVKTDPPLQMSVWRIFSETATSQLLSQKDLNAFNSKTVPNISAGKANKCVPIQPIRNTNF